jgi:hypothetical protein
MDAGINLNMKKGIVNIKGKDYMTVARRVELAHEEKAFEKLSTEVISHNPVVIKAVVIIKGREFSGISSVSLTSERMIEKYNPYEVAETSAVGRALGFAGYGIVDGIASADEMHKSAGTYKDEDGMTHEPAEESASPMASAGTCSECHAPNGKPHATGCKNVAVVASTAAVLCEKCGKPAKEKKGLTKAGKNYHGIFCSTNDKSHTRWFWN